MSSSLIGVIKNPKVIIRPPLLIDCIINSSFFVKAIVDTGCLCFSVFDESIVRNHELYEELIPSRVLRLADGKVTAKVNRIVNVHLDIDGHQEQIWGYVIPNLAYPIILGKPWLELNNVVYSAKRHCLRIGSRKFGIIVRESGWYERDSPTCVRERVACVSSDQAVLEPGVKFAGLLRCAKRSKNNIVGAISVNDITRALEPKKKVSREEVENMLPKEIKRFTDLFLDDDSHHSKSLPPHRPGIDTNIALEQDDQGKNKQVPWGPLYGMSREELLVLRKTLSELLDKRWIRVSSSPGGAPVLFIKKSQGGLRFCVDCRALNAITKKDRYPLPLIKETLRMVANASYISKIDVRAAFHRLRVAKGDEWKTAFRTRFGSY